MSVLAPFFLLGGLAVGLPILAHLIRRRPRGEHAFSSLMFLRASPPRLTRRSRLDQWPLLLVRSLAIVMLATAFARPFLRSTSRLDSDSLGRRIVVLADTSASMRRGDIWAQAGSVVEAVAGELHPDDEVALVSFDNEPELLLSFAASGRRDAAQRDEMLVSRFRELTPTWFATDLGKALSFAAELAATYEPESSGDDGTDGDAGQVILISDLQAGSQTESLQSFAWPESMRLDVRRVRPNETTNATLQILATPSADQEETDRVRVRVTNSGESARGQFKVAWADETGSAGNGLRLPVQVPPGQSRVVRMPPPTPGDRSLVLFGDDHAFDNVCYFVRPEPRPQTVPYLGPGGEQLPAADDGESSAEADATAAAGNEGVGSGEPSRSLFYYLRQAPLGDRHREVTVERMSADELTAGLEPRRDPLVVIAEPTGEDTAQRLRRYVASGGEVLLVLTDSMSSVDATETLRGLGADRQVEVSEADIEDYAMWSQIDFGHRLFAAMADPQFNDFTKIRFWSHREIENLGGDWRVPARFDDGAPAVVEKTIGDGRLTVLASGWHPEESQLALSTKFLPLLMSFFEPRSTSAYASTSLGGELEFEPSAGVRIRTPVGESVSVEAASDLEVVDRPGIYAWIDGESTQPFAVNLGETESRTEPMGEEALERFGVLLGETPPPAVRTARARQMRDVELESQQKLWQWLLLGALVLLGIESWMGGWLTGRGPSEPAASG